VALFFSDDMWWMRHARGHTVTLFNRGKQNVDLFPQIEKLCGDRDSDLEAIRRRRWDAVIETYGYVPRIVRASATLLANAAEHYTFISTVSEFSDFNRLNVGENAPLGKLADESVE
jgi:2'-hydroxyisoflavone reductase